jgi:hypothetical protein
MPTEVCHYRLSLRGKPVGSHVLSTAFRGRTAFLEGRLQVQGSLGNAAITQRSKVHRQQFFSFSFEEETNAPGDRRQFQVTFDIEAGLVRASKGSDEASVPYVTSLEDPLGLLYHLRHLAPEDGETLRVPMLGKDVTVERVGRTTLDTALGEQEAQAFALHPGGSYVYVATQAPHPILMMSQRVGGQVLEAHLVRIDEEAESPPQDTDDAREARRGGRRRRRRRARRG